VVREAGGRPACRGKNPLGGRPGAAAHRARPAGASDGAAPIRRSGNRR
jgi:hypothetical protein